VVMDRGGSHRCGGEVGGAPEGAYDSEVEGGRRRLSERRFLALLAGGLGQNLVLEEEGIEAVLLIQSDSGEQGGSDSEQSRGNGGCA
jgi:hypothetical protein